MLLGIVEVVEEDHLSGPHPDARGRSGEAPSGEAANFLPVYHGTRRSLAERIVAEGFGHLPVEQQLNDVACRYGIDAATVIEHLADNSRFAATDERSGTVSFTLNPAKAAGWANRAPEATWEALWTIYRLGHPELGHDWNQSDEGHLWVIAQQLHDPPVVMTVAAAMSELRAAHMGGTTASDWLAELVQQGRTAEEITELFALPPEWRAPASGQLSVLKVEEVAVTVDGSLARFMSGQTAEAFGAQVTDGRWGPTPTRDEWGESWFSFEQIWGRLPKDRQRDLSELVALPIESILGAGDTTGETSGP